MDMMEFTTKVETDNPAVLFRNFFEENMAAYRLLYGLNFFNIYAEESKDKTSIMYSVRLLNDEDKDKLISVAEKLEVAVFDKIYKPKIFMNGDLLCITFYKSE